MTTTKIIAAALLFGATPALAQTAGLDVGATAALKVPGANVNAGVKADVKVDAQLAKVVDRADKAIDARVADLQALAARVNEMQNVSADQKASIAADVQTNVDGLTALKAKVDADTDTTTAKGDEKSILGSFRIYALVMPRGHLIAAADRITTLGTLMTALGVKLQARITVAQSAGKDVTALNSSLADITAKVADANAKASLVVSSTTALTPDGGDKAKMQANTAVLKAARTEVKAGTEDLQAARKDVNSILKALKEFHLNASTSSTTTVGQ